MFGAPKFVASLATCVTLRRRRGRMPRRALRSILRVRRVVTATATTMNPATAANEVIPSVRRRLDARLAIPAPVSSISTPEAWAVPMIPGGDRSREVRQLMAQMTIHILSETVVWTKLDVIGGRRPQHRAHTALSRSRDPHTRKWIDADRPKWIKYNMSDRGKIGFNKPVRFTGLTGVTLHTTLHEDRELRP